jgi:hypothetical protein
MAGLGCDVSEFRLAFYGRGSLLCELLDAPGLATATQSTRPATCRHTAPGRSERVRKGGATISQSPQSSSGLITFQLRRPGCVPIKRRDASFKSEFGNGSARGSRWRLSIRLTPVMAAGAALKVANLGSLLRSAQAPRFSEGSMSRANDTSGARCFCAGLSVIAGL